MASVVRVPVADCTPERLDTGFYSQQYFAAKNSIQKAGFTLEPIGSVCEPWQFGAYALCNEIVWADRENGTPFIKAEAIESPLIDVDALSFVTKATHALLSKSALKAGDIIVSTSGTVGRLAVLPESIPAANSNQDTIKFSLRDTSYDAHFVAAWLTTAYAQAFMTREAGGAVQQHIYLYNFRRIPLLKAQPVVQRYVGEKVRQAERLRAWALSTQKAAADQMPAYRAGIARFYGASFRVPAKHMMPSRLDSPFFHPDHRALDEAMIRSGCVSLGSKAVAVSDGWDKNKKNTFRYFEIGGLHIGSGTVRPVEMFTSEAPSRATTAIRQGDVLVSTVRPSRRNVGFVIDSFPDQPMVATSGFSVLRFQSLEEAAFYHCWLRTEDATSQLLRWNSGSAYPAIDEDVPFSLLVPDFEKASIDLLGKRLLDAQYALWLSAKLTEAAKLLIEALIEGRIDEPALIAAQRELDEGNETDDYRVLSQLHLTRLDGKSEPLFEDFGLLYDLLKQANLG